MGRDKILIEEFLRGYNHYFKTTFRVVARPDELQRQKQAVDVIAQNDDGETLAIEHTVIQPFVGEKDDTQRLLRVIAPLETDASLRAPGKSIDVSVAVGAIPKGPDWKVASAKVVDWFRRSRLSFPEGQSTHRVPNVGFDLALRIDKGDSPYPEGRIYVSRSDMPEDFPSVVSKALKDKVPKLAGTHADKRILLFEKDNLPPGYVEICKILESLDGQFPELSKIDAAWVVNTVAGASEGCLFFYRVWPGGITEKF